MRILTPASYVTTPWSNGGGLTTEIAREGGTPGGFDFLWRVSAARVASDGPFSRLPGLDRLLVVTEGAGLELAFADGPVHRLRPDEVLAFAGERTVAGRLPDGPVRDLNVMVRRGARVAHLAILTGAWQAAATLRPDEVLLAHVLVGIWHAGELPAGQCDLGPGDTLLAEGAGQPALRPVGAGRLAVVHIHPPRQEP